MKAFELDKHRKFIFEHSDIRGELASLEQSLRQALAHQDIPQDFKPMFGEFFVAAALLSRTVNFKGTLTLQARGQGDVELIVVDVREQQFVRGVMQLKTSAKASAGGLPQQLGKEGLLSVTIDPDGGERYQSIVTLSGQTLAQCLEGYFLQSEQLPTRLWLACDGRRASGLLLQRLPEQLHGAQEGDDMWQTQVCLAETLTPQELLATEHLVLIRRLFHESDLRVFEPQDISFACHCSKERYRPTLEQMGENTLDELLAVHGCLKTQCHFCGKQYLFSREDVAKLFN